MARGIAGAQQNTTIFPATVEVDLVFPRNDTYAPAPLFPIVFAIQNAQAAAGLSFYLGWSIDDVHNDFYGVTSDYRNLQSANYSASGNDPFFIVFYTTLLNGTEGHFYLQWMLSALSCAPPNPEDVFHLEQANYTEYVDYTTFTLRNNAQKPSAVTSQDSCPIPITTFNVTGMMKLEDFPGHSLSPGVCALEAHPSPTANPCAVKVDSVVDSNISASVTALACASHITLTSCPKALDKSNTGAPRSDLGLVGSSGVLLGLVLGMILLGFHFQG